MSKVKFGSLKVGQTFKNPSHHMLSDEIWVKQKLHAVEFKTTDGDEVAPDRYANCTHGIWFDHLSDDHEVVKL